MYLHTCTNMWHDWRQQRHGLFWLRINKAASAADPQCPLSTCGGCFKRSSLLAFSHAALVPAPTVMATSRWRCKQDPNKFCYICSEHTFSKSRRNITYLVKQAYSSYLGISIKGQDKPWAPYMLCKHCINCMRPWNPKPGKSMKIGVSMI